MPPRSETAGSALAREARLTARGVLRGDRLVDPEGNTLIVDGFASSLFEAAAGAGVDG